MEKKPKPKYVVDFNKKLKLFYVKTIHFVDEQEVDIDDPKYFIPVTSYFNYNKDRIEFMLKIHYAKIKHLKIGKKSVVYKLGNLQPVNIPIILSEKINDSGNEMCTINIHGNFKDRLLHLFQFYQKEFTLTIFYTTEDNKKYASSFSVSLPKIDDQHDWDPKKKFIPVFNPEDIGGFELKKAFDKQFNPYYLKTQEELEVVNALLNYKEAHFDDRFENYDFLSMFQYMVAIEDLDSSKQMKEYSLDFASVYKYNLCPVLLQNSVKQHLRHLMCDEKLRDYVRNIYIIQARKKLPVDVMEFEFVYIFDQSDYQQYHDDLEELAFQRKVGKIVHIFGDVILFLLPRQKGKRQNAHLEEDRPYHIEFVPNRVSIRIVQRALEDMKKMDMCSYLQNFEMLKMNRLHETYLDDLEWFNKELADNDEQQMAVENIVNCTSFPSPFVIFGGPGTGKSSTIVEAISQIVKLKPKSHVLIAASSNSTCDDIGNRLLKYISINKILRLYSTSFDLKPEKIDSMLQKVSNFRKRNNCTCQKRSCPVQNAHDDPSYEEFHTARVVIVTLVTAGRIISSEVGAGHFDYIFIDEAGSVSEPEAYIPLSGLGLSKKGVHAQIVLSGDHKQLGPIVKNAFAKRLGLETSLMERLMDTDEKYQKFETEYDYNYVIQLKQNYRNHPAIMRFSNENFYDSQLVSVCSDEIKNYALDPELLLFNPTFPIIFHTTRAFSEEVGTSLKNEGELIILSYYIQVLLNRGLGKNKVQQTDIGIISPYRGQRDRMLEVFGDSYPNIEIGTVDSFQGREKKIIFLSCVRSGTNHVGFLRNEKRLNVALTRAQSLLIIIGNAATLQKCSIWNKFITYCYENKATVGDIFSVNHEGIGNDAMAGTEELPENGTDDEYDGSYFEITRNIDIAGIKVTMHKKTTNTSGVVDFNQQLKLINLKTSQIVGKQKREIKNPKLFLPVSCNFNFNEDRIEFMLDIHNDELREIKIQKPTVHFKFSKLDPVSIPIISRQQKTKGRICTIIIHACFKDRVLHLFEADQKEFLLTVFYTTKDNKKFASAFSVSLPKIDNQNEKPTVTKFIDDHNPEDLKCGIELKKLFKKDFMSCKGMDKKEQDMLQQLKKYEAATMSDRFNKFNFLDMFQNMVAIEDLECIKQAHSYSLDCAKIYKYNKCPNELKTILKKELGNKLDDVDYIRKIYIIQATKKLPVDASEFCGVFFHDQFDYKLYQNDCKKLFDSRMDGKIEHLFNDIIVVRIFFSKRSKRQSSISEHKSYHIEFIPNRVSIRTAQRALEDMKNMNMKSYLQKFETKKNVTKSGSKETFEKLKWFSPTIESNKEQMIAVKNIVNCTSFPSPFIIFGGPGTGKSTTIVESIAQIVKMKPDSHVLFTSSSNSTCDDIGNRLLKYISINKILRIYSPSFDQKLEKIDKLLRDVSNFRKLGNSKGCSSKDPSYKEFMTARVIIVTIVSAGRIINAGYPADHFDYIFIDEAGFVSEPESYIPLSGLGMSKEGVHAQIVLAGDHKQLRPVVTNLFARDMGLETSLMERLMDNDEKYKRSLFGYNQNFVVQLKQNYRNHPAIMHFSNENFYDSQLVSMRTDRMKHMLINNEEFPIIFHSNKSSSKEVGTSLKNEGELVILEVYIDVLLKKSSDKNRVEQTDIGIISPYSAQRDRLNEKFRKKYPKVEIGTVDSFQGREKKIIFVSCVRSGTNHVGFLSNEKRLNVALTRAQSMLVVIGNVMTLQQSDIWDKFIAYCHENNATVGDLKYYRPKKTDVKDNDISTDDIIEMLKNLKLN
ncbi:uncharacterized protein [Chironomus tepperi]|uniref:uncharacterized protein n=1 Tax=Chironomus tepperi TaxID=113505 RepID=UPI00391F74BB